MVVGGKNDLIAWAKSYKLFSVATIKLLPLPVIFQGEFRDTDYQALGPEFTADSVRALVGRRFAQCAAGQDAQAKDGRVSGSPAGFQQQHDHARYEKSLRQRTAVPRYSPEHAARTGSRASMKMRGTVRKMRIHDFGGAKALRADEVEYSQPDASQILVSVKAASVNPVDFKISSGKYPAVKEDRLPYTLGRDVSGIVEKCGAQAAKFSVGDEVLGMIDIAGGGYAEKAVLNQNSVTRKPSNIDFVHAAAIPLAGLTAWQGLFRHGNLTAGQSVLIHGGSGGVGHFAVQFAKAQGARVLTTVSTGNVEFARSLGADVVIDYKTQRFEDLASNLDMVFDLIDGDTRKRSWGLLKHGGMLVTTLTEPSQEIAQQHGVHALRYTVEPDGGDLDTIARLVASGQVKVHIARTFPLANAYDALASVEHGGTVGKVVLAVS
jgi:NADPH:quinone reductase-like Zn-dependent oxidoreductase